MKVRVFLPVLLFFLAGCSNELVTETNISDNIAKNSVSRDSIDNIDKIMSTDIESLSRNNIIANDSLNLEKSEDSVAKEIKKYTFYDVYRNEYIMDVNPDIPENPYVDSCYTYSRFDKKGNVLADENLPEPDFNNHDIQDVGYTGIISYADEKYTSRFGIDVSRHQGKINWEKVKEAGVEFAYIRAGYRGYGRFGDLNEDRRFRENVEGAQSVGIDVGVYIYAQAINEEEAVEEAEYILNLISDYDIDLQVVYDPESVIDAEARTDNVSGEQFTKNAKAFCDKIKDAGYEPMIYANMLWEAYELDLSELEGIPMWYADYENLPQTPYEYKVWQYSRGGRIPGIPAEVDLNLMINTH